MKSGIAFQTIFVILVFIIVAAIALFLIAGGSKCIDKLKECVSKATGGRLCSFTKVVKACIPG